MRNNEPLTGQMLYEQLLAIRASAPAFGIPDPAPWAELLVEAKEAYDALAAFLADRERRAQAEAWDDGFDSGCYGTHPNPFTEEAS